MLELGWTGCDLRLEHQPSLPNCRDTWGTCSEWAMGVVGVPQPSGDGWYTVFLTPACACEQDGWVYPL